MAPCHPLAVDLAVYAVRGLQCISRSSLVVSTPRAPDSGLRVAACLPQHLCALPVSPGCLTALCRCFALQVLHDAFFKYQTKPKLSGQGEMYYEGKEFEASITHARPGVLSAELQTALGMSEGSPPPWLVNMQVGWVGGWTVPHLQPGMLQQRFQHFVGRLFAVVRELPDSHSHVC